MQHLLRLALVFVVVAFGCGAPPTGVQNMETTPTDKGPIQFNTQEVTAQSPDCGQPGGKCARVRVSFPEITGGGTEAVRDNLDLFLLHDLVTRMRSFVPEQIGNGIGNIEALAAAFLDQFHIYVAEFPDTAAEWEIDIECELIHNTASFVTLDIAESADTGGAHPNARRRLVSFDVETGQLLGADDLTADLKGLGSLVEQQLRSDRDLDPDADLAAEGFWIPNEGLPLPENVGIVAEGLLFHWDAYEIAPYSMGPVNVIVPAEEAKSIVHPSFW